MDFINALHWGPVGVEHNYEYGILENPARAGIQMMHRKSTL
jgi:cytochrome c oxidase assembly protein subunit 15